jgi:tRNA A37 N6-isopentenylltransferase MiaA
LLREILDLRTIARSRNAPTDYTRGIFQSIGYKEFDAYLQHIESTSCTPPSSTSLRPDPNDGEGLQLFNQAVEEMKISTHQLARKQVQWIRNKLRPELQSRGSKNVHLVSLDATNVNEWESNVRQKAVQLTDGEC